MRSVKLDHWLLIGNLLKAFADSVVTLSHWCLSYECLFFLAGQETTCIPWSVRWAAGIWRRWYKMTNTSIKAFSYTQSSVQFHSDATLLRPMAQGIWLVSSQVVVKNLFLVGSRWSVCPITRNTRNLGWALSKDLLRVPGGEQVRVSWAVASGSPLLFSSQSPAVSCWLSGDTKG